MNVITKNLDEQAPAYRQYPRQNQPQRAYIELDCRGEGELTADYSGEIGNAVPVYYWHGLAVRWSIPPETTGDSLRQLFTNEDFLAICQRIVDGFEEHWDGSNYVGKYTDDADEAVEEVETLLSASLESCEIWSAEAWLFTSCQLTEHWNTQPIGEAVATLEGYIETNQMIDGDLEDALINEALSEFEHCPDRLTSVHIAELLKRGGISTDEAADWAEYYGPK